MTHLLRLSTQTKGAAEARVSNKGQNHILYYLLLEYYVYTYVVYILVFSVCVPFILTLRVYVRALSPCLRNIISKVAYNKWFNDLNTFSLLGIVGASVHDHVDVHKQFCVWTECVSEKL